jgi:hypothetical protein
MWWKRIWRVARVVLLALLVLLLIGAGWHTYLNAPASYVVTPPTLPAENAYDGILAAAKLAKGVPHLERDGDHYIISPRPGTPKPWDPPAPPLTEEQIVALERAAVAKALAKNQKAIRAYREAVAHPLVTPLIPDEDTKVWQARNQTWYQARRTGRDLLVADMWQCQQAADWRGTADAANALYRYETVAPSTFSEATNAMAALRDAAGRLAPRERRPVVAALEATLATRPSFASRLDAHRPYRMADLLDQLRQQSTWGSPYYFRIGLAFPNVEPTPLEDRSACQNLWAAFTIPNRAVPGNMDRYLKACVDAARKPISAHPAFPQPPSDYFCYRAYHWTRWDLKYLGYVFTEFQQQGALLSLCLDGYRTEHKAYPANLQALVDDGWIAHIPTDPITQADTLLYRKTADGFVLYSRGPDGIDNNGTAIKNVALYELERRRVYVDSTGDVVYGVNNSVESFFNDRL